MYAIIESGGKQFKVNRDRKIRVPSLGGEPGDAVTFDRVVFASDGENVTVGNPLVSGVRVTGAIVRHGRGEKIVVFKMKRRHRYRKKTGHRQGFTEVAITGLELGEARPGREGGEGEADEVGSRQGQEGARQVGPYVCEACGRGFATERGLQQHRAKAHVD